MRSLAHAVRDLRVVILAGAMLFLPAASVAQQEVDPDHFEATTKAQKARPADHRKQAAANHGTTSVSRRHTSNVRKTAGQKKVVAENRRPA